MLKIKDRNSCFCGVLRSKIIDNKTKNEELMEDDEVSGI